MGSAHSGPGISTALVRMSPCYSLLCPSHCVGHLLSFLPGHQEAADAGGEGQWWEEPGQGSAGSGFRCALSLGLSFLACRMGIIYSLVVQIL